MDVCVFFNIIQKACFKILEKYVMESWTYDPWYENGFVMLLIHKKNSIFGRNFHNHTFKNITFKIPKSIQNFNHVQKKFSEKRWAFAWPWKSQKFSILHFKTL